MKTSTTLRGKMLEAVATSLETPTIISPDWDRYIEFRLLDDTPMCQLQYKTLELGSGVGDDTAYEFTAQDGSTVLRGIVDLAGGQVAKFLITGVAGDTISGTVGTISSAADIRFNMLEWTKGVTVITMTRLRLVIPQGT